MTAQGRAPWLASPLIAAASFLGLFGLGVMIDLGSWIRSVALVLAITTVAVVATRLASRSRALPTLIGAIAAVMAMVPLFATDEYGGRHLLITPGALRDLGRVIREGIDYAEATVAPAPPDPGLTAILTVSLLLLFLAAEHVAVSWRAGATAGLLLLIPWMPAVIFQHRVSMSALLVAIGLWLAVLAVTRRPSESERRPGIGGAIAATAAALAGVLLVAPTALGGHGWGMIPRLDTLSGLDGGTRLNLALDLRTSLTANSTTPVLVYSTEGNRPDAFRLYTLADFDGVQWTREAVETPVVPAGTEPLWTVPVDDWNDRERSRIDMQVLNLREANLPLPPSPRSVEVDGPWYYDEERDELVGDGVTAQETRYSIVTATNFHQKEQLEAAEATIATGENPVHPRYLEVSPAIDSQRVGDLAREVTADADSRYDKALALQSFLRDTSEFTYDTSVDPTGGDAVNTFLNDREGYCVQFATTMVTMARTLDIPARMAVGFLSGSATEQGTYVVQGGDAHAWPELWFPGEGWVRFEPTPAIQSGMPPVYADPYAGNAPDWESMVPGGVPEVAPGTPAIPDDASETPGADSERSASAPLLPVWAWITIGVLVTIGILAGLWLLRRRTGAGSILPRGPEAQWESLRTRLPESLRWPATLTPHEAAEFVASRMRLLGPGLTGAAAEAMTRLTHVVEDHRYAPTENTEADVQLRQWADLVVSEAQETNEAASSGDRTRSGMAFTKR